MQRYDVIVYEINSNKVSRVVGKNLRRDGAFNSAQSRLDTMLSRINANYNAEIVPTGTYKEGDKRS